MSGPIHLSATDFAAVLEAAGLDSGDGNAEATAAETPGMATGAVPGDELEVATGGKAEPAARAEAGAEAEAAPGAVLEPPPDGASADPDTVPAPDAVPVPEALPDPFDDADALEELEHEVVTLSAHIEAATYRLLVLIADFDRRRGWELGGHRSCAHWLHYVTGLDLGAAREKVRAARALKHLPRTSEAMARGELSFSKVRALTRVATPECEEELLGVARDSTTAHLERVVRKFRTHSRADEEVLERARYESRAFSVFPDDEGMYVVKGKVPAEVGALLMRAVEAAADALFCREAREETTPKQRRADALGLVAERAMAAGFGGGADRNVSGETRISGSRAEDADRDGSSERSISEDRDGGEAVGDPADTEVSAEIPISGGTRAERYQVFLHVEPDTLRMGGGDSGRSHLEDGTRLAAETARRLCCDVAMVTVARGTDGSVLDIGRRSRSIPPAIDRAMKIRDGGYCRFPGCNVRFTDGHHVIHWADGGETKLTNLVSLCVYHHRKLHEGGWRLQYDADADIATFIDPRGHIRYDARPRSPAPLFGEAPAANGRRPASNGAAAADAANGHRSASHGGGTEDVASGARAAEALADQNRARGIEPDGEKLRARYRRESDIPWEILAPALEALDEAHFGG